jgi:hypothetical protein
MNEATDDGGVPLGAVFEQLAECDLAWGAALASADRTQREPEPTGYIKRVG